MSSLCILLCLCFSIKTRAVTLVILFINRGCLHSLFIQKLAETIVKAFETPKISQYLAREREQKIYIILQGPT
jgi:hypothetical protein